jgi:hypothetical protein
MAHVQGCRKGVEVDVEDRPAPDVQAEAPADLTGSRLASGPRPAPAASGGPGDGPADPTR